MTNNLGLESYFLDDEKAYISIERAFGIELQRTRAGWSTVGDVYETVRAACSGEAQAGGKCPGAMAYYRLRSAYSELAADVKLRPGTAIFGIAKMPRDDFFHYLSKRSGLELPYVLTISRAGYAGIFLILCAVIAFFGAAATASWLGYSASAVLLLAGLLLKRFDPGTPRPDCRTLGQLARKAAGLNFGLLIKDGASRNDKAIWNALVQVLSEHTYLPDSEIRPGTRLLKAGWF